MEWYRVSGSHRSERMPKLKHSLAGYAECAAAGKGKLPPRLHAHADMDVLTILFNRVGELSLLSLVDCMEWHAD